MQCPSCKEPIDNDSRYCDQCGGQIMICPACNVPRKGKFCSQCNNELVPAGSAAPAGAAAPVQAGTAPAAQPAQAFTPPPSGPSTGSSAVISAGSGLKLSSAAHGIMIEAGDGDVIGRKAGKFTGVFGRFNFISGTHCSIIKMGAGWAVMDLGSTNGTFCNGNKLAPNVPCPVSNGTLIKVADVELLAGCDEEGGTQRL